MAVPEISGFAGLSQIWERHYVMPGSTPSAVVTLAGTMVCRSLCMFDEQKNGYLNLVCAMPLNLQVCMSLITDALSMGKYPVKSALVCLKDFARSAAEI